MRNYVLAAIFWASTSLTGAVAVLLAALTFGFALGMIGVGIARSGGSNIVLINAVGYKVLMFQGDRLTFPPSNWSPAEIVVSGIAPALVLLAGLYVLSHLWLRSRLASRGLDLDERRPPRGWERNAIGFAVLVAALSLSSCLVLVFASNMVGIGRPGHLDLPSDFWRNPLGALAFVSLLIFFCSPVLGLLWSTRRTGAKSPGTKAQVQPYK